ncbi:hypothetical protein GE21DRAFT_1272866 [Neurospora crassa]|nr:hypothetical protein GE21DRAFT_1272866 [Neurospora crassa]
MKDGATVLALQRLCLSNRLAIDRPTTVPTSTQLEVLTRLLASSYLLVPSSPTVETSWICTSSPRVTLHLSLLPSSGTASRGSIKQTEPTSTRSVQIKFSHRL